MSLRQTLNDSMKDAMKAKDAKRLSTVRLMLAALKDRDIAARTETSRAELLAIFAKVAEEGEAVQADGELLPEIVELTDVVPDLVVASR